ncbi:chorismate mutase [Streptomyces sp. NPDC057682]|uniref:chorismate mutase n=1 Tax=unclassified Streptomyces TaxID=2593676 RepID=UPI003656ACF0
MSPVDSSRLVEHQAHLAALDRSIISLIEERASTDVQLRTLRRLAGLHEFQLTRENEVLHQYHDALGRQGTSIALQLLSIARNEVRRPVGVEETATAA